MTEYMANPGGFGGFNQAAIQDTFHFDTNQFLTPVDGDNALLDYDDLFSMLQQPDAQGSGGSSGSAFPSAGSDGWAGPPIPVQPVAATPGQYPKPQQLKQPQPQISKQVKPSRDATSKRSRDAVSGKSKQHQMKDLEAIAAKKSQDLKRLMLENQELKFRSQILEKVIQMRDYQLKVMRGLPEDLPQYWGAGKPAATTTTTTTTTTTQAPAGKPPPVSAATQAPAAAAPGTPPQEAPAPGGVGVGVGIGGTRGGAGGCSGGGGGASWSGGATTAETAAPAPAAAAVAAAGVSDSNEHGNGGNGGYTAVEALRMSSCSCLLRASGGHLSAADRERFRSLQKGQLMAGWKHYLSEVAVPLLALESNGQDERAAASVLQLAGEATHMLKHASLLAPDTLMVVTQTHLETEVLTAPDPSHWHAVVRTLELSPDQIRELRAVFRLVSDIMSAVLAERKAINMRLAEGVHLHDSVADIRVAMKHLTVSPECEVLQALQRSMRREKAAHLLLRGFLFGRTLSVLQFVKAAVYSYPWMPDAAAIVATVVEQAEAAEAAEGGEGDGEEGEGTQDGGV
ncbi:hypothetical protein VOLCADRAFT_120496 [Volvox carteri f. nagariensis]|uniref:BZIP domain-containing protein n=1 Tax=Volvox carteri f. nagariensis TaxID=3068 RepID=D8TMI1_VOLCA|nr:uncharacterized protein VOLCADRAFT_120496 [Volvox carteri f. nagariensis]EFJ51261.1 hypothetical protein VOLCADRAFT_120496 [Volvox carteri f. nagariensis]|eukprot:XP_002947728.1 hypothetical protein VOLCADRAFT_120496 [Volvox carteri f. nagariensis]